jgi:hypothetical protein
LIFYGFVCLFVYLFVLETGSHSEALAGLELTYIAQAGLKLTILLPAPASFRITGMSHHTWVFYVFLK